MSKKAPGRRHGATLPRLKSPVVSREDVIKAEGGTCTLKGFDPTGECMYREKKNRTKYQTLGESLKINDR